ncbi:helix-turn-helix domain-containing protein [Nonomuraea sp. NPDC049141]|uniref:helix-turn-helix domain-containing protein n=1 Tax=Nonomuraea sp. NPDC049141 TaxID=3155500 RepID=UPI003406F5CB
MARKLEISDQEVQRLRREGLGAPEIAKALGKSRATVFRALQRLDEVREYVRHDDVFPWPVHQMHGGTLPTKYIRTLSRAAKTGGGDMDYLMAAFRWANGMIERGVDIGYDPDYPGTDVTPEGGYYEMPEPVGGGFIRRLRDAALEAGRRRER